MPDHLDRDLAIARADSSISADKSRCPYSFLPKTCGLAWQVIHYLQVQDDEKHPGYKWRIPIRF
jgi:hypothetical protein